jgi:hypothetical protein
VDESSQNIAPFACSFEPSTLPTLPPSPIKLLSHIIASSLAGQNFPYIIYIYILHFLQFPPTWILKIKKQGRRDRDKRDKRQRDREMGFSKEERSKRVLRGVKTVFFLITMLISLLLFSAPVLLVIADALLPSALLSASLSPTALSLQTLSSHFQNYDFRYSLIDIPLISIIRSAIIICK